MTRKTREDERQRIHRKLHLSSLRAGLSCFGTIVVMSLIASGPVTAGEDREAKVIAAGREIALQVPYSIRYLATGGYWEHGGDYGTYRVVVVSQGQEHTQAYTYVQWIRLSGPAEKRGEVVETVSVDELNRNAALIVSAVDFPGNGVEDPRARLKMVDRATKEELEGTLQLSTPGMYRFKTK